MNEAENRRINKKNQLGWVSSAVVGLTTVRPRKVFKNNSFKFAVISANKRVRINIRDKKISEKPTSGAEEWHTGNASRRKFFQNLRLLFSINSILLSLD